MAATAGRPWRRIVDLCAGRGTKTRQLARLHPQAEVFATDTDATRLEQLRRATAHLQNVTVLESPQKAGGCDLLVLDLPCSNTGVLARRPEARYRYNAMELERMVDLQQRIAEDGIQRSLAAGGAVLWSTCSLESQENHRQVRWLESRFNLKMSGQAQWKPGGSGPTYHDGAYHALLVSDRRDSQA